MMHEDATKYAMRGEMLLSKEFTGDTEDYGGKISSNNIPSKFSKHANELWNKFVEERWD